MRGFKKLNHNRRKTLRSEAGRGSTAGFGGTGVCVGVRSVCLPSGGRARGVNGEVIGERKTNIFGKLVRQKVVFLEEVGPARSGGSTKSGPFVRHAAVQDAGRTRGKRRARRLGTRKRLIRKQGRSERSKGLLFKWDARTHSGRAFLHSSVRESRHSLRVNF